MKSLKQIVVASLALGAVSAYADFSIGNSGITSVGVGDTVPDITSAGSIISNPYLVSETTPTVGVINGVSEYTLDISQVAGPGTFSSSTLVLAVTPSSGNLTVTGFSLLGAGLSSPVPFAGSYISSVTAANSDVTVYVDWSLASGSSGAYSLLLAGSETSIDTIVGGTQGSTDGNSVSSTYLTTVPEPGQVIGGCMLLGCGALVFTGRRFMAKKA